MIDGVPARLIHAEQQLRSAVQLIDRGFWTEGVAAVEIALQDIEVLKRRAACGCTPHEQAHCRADTGVFAEHPDCQKNTNHASWARG